MLVKGFLEVSALRSPEKTALVCGGRRLTYQEIDRSADALAGGLRQLGLVRGDRVVIHAENSVEAVLAIFGTLKAGGVFVVVNPTIKSEKLAYIAADCQAKVIVSSRRAIVESQAALRLPGVVAIGISGADAGDGTPTGVSPVLSFDSLLSWPGGKAILPEDGIDLDIAAIVYTSGSTGTPKGVVLSHGNIVAAVASITSYLGNTHRDIILNVLPLSFDYGLYQVLMAFAVGGTLILERSFAYPPVLLETLVRERVTGFPIVPTIAALLVRQDLTRYDFSALRYITSTGAALPPSHITAIRTMLPGVRLYSMYGITEAKRVSFLAPEEIDVRPESVGKPMPNVDVFVADPEGRLSPTGVGELVVRGPNVMQGYWGKAEETDAVLRPGLLPGERVLFTGDIFRIDDEGYMYFVGRKDDIIKCCGEKVSPREIENALHELPGVLEAAVFGVPDPILGTAIQACVTVEPAAGLTEQDVARYCAQRLEDLLVPRVVQFLREMPRTTTGKIDRAALVRCAG